VIRAQAGNGVVGDDGGNVVGGVGTVRTKPLRGPVERAEKRARGDRRLDRRQCTAAHAIGDQRADAALVAIALGDDACAQPAGKRADFEVRGGAFDLVDQTEDVRDRQTAQPIEQRTVVAPRVGERREQAIGGAILTEEQQLVLAAEVVIEVAGREVGGDGNLAHAGGGEAALAEDPRRGGEDADAAGVGPP